MPHPSAPRCIRSEASCLLLALATLFGVLWLVPPAFAQRQQPTVHTDQEIGVRAYTNQPRAYVGSSIPFNIEIRGVGEANAYDLTKLVPNLQIEYRGSSQGSSSQIRIIDGRRTEFRTISITHQYTITPLRAGRYTIPGIEIEINGETHQTSPVQIDAIGAQERTDIRATLEVDHTTAFVGQPITASLHIDAIPELRTLPTILAPATIEGARLFTLPIDKVSADPTTGPSRRAMEQVMRLSTNTGNHPAVGSFFGEDAYLKRSQIQLAGQPALRWTMRVIIVPTREGTLTIEPITVRAEVDAGTRRDMFSRPQPVVLETEGLQIDVRPLPLDPAPLDSDPWERRLDLPMVGRFSIEASATPPSVNVGDPIEVHLSLTGWEPLERQGRLDLRAIEGFERRFRTANDSIPAERDGSTLRFSTQIRATNERADHIPPIGFRAFDPIDGVWKTIQTEPIPLDIRATRVVRGGDVVAPDAAPAGASLQPTRDTNSLGPIAVSPTILAQSGFTLHGVVRSPTVIAAVAIPPAGCLACAAFIASARQRKQRPKALSARAAAARAITALDALDHNAPAAATADAVSGTMRQFIIDRGMSPNDPPPPPVNAVLDACDAIRFGGNAHTNGIALINQAKAAIEETRTRAATPQSASQPTP